MKKFLSKKSHILTTLLLLLTAISCTNELELQEADDWLKLCTEWKTPSVKVKEMMKTYTQLSSSSEYIIYKGKGKTDAISYKFANDSLCASAIVMKAEVVDIKEIRSTFSRYEHLGEYNSYELFIGEEQLVTIKEYTQNEVFYIAVGYIPFELKK